MFIFPFLMLNIVLMQFVFFAFVYFYTIIQYTEFLQKCSIDTEEPNDYDGMLSQAVELMKNIDGMDTIDDGAVSKLADIFNQLNDFSHELDGRDRSKLFDPVEQYIDLIYGLLTKLFTGKLTII